MKDLLNQLLTQARGASTAVKTSVALGLVGLALVLSAGFWFASRPHYVVFQGELNSGQLQRVVSALSSAGVDFNYSQPPGPHVVYVEEGDLPIAFGAVADAGALADVDGGILGASAGGLADIFKGHDERRQLTRKREWQDMEQMLEHLDFVREARVRTSEPSTLGSTASAERSCSVTLVVRPGFSLDTAAKRTIASQVRLGLGVSEENLIVADQTGRTLFDGRQSMESGGTSDWEEWAREEDARLETKVNQELAMVLGTGKSLVSVRSNWDFDFETSVTSSADPKSRSVARESSESASMPVFSDSAGVGGAVGSASNLADPSDYGVTSAAAPTSAASASSAPLMGESTESRSEKVYLPSQEVVQTVRRRPLRERLNVALYLDESLEATAPTIADAVKTMVGLDPKRQDVLSLQVLPFPTPEAVDDELVVEPGVNPMVELLLTRGLEFAAGLGFLVVLFFSLRRSKGDLPQSVGEGAEQFDGIDPESQPSLMPTGTGGARGASSGSSTLGKPDTQESVDPEMLALARVQELLENEPDKVGELLTNWVRGAEA